MAIFCQNSALQYGNYKSDIFIWIEFFDLLNVNQYLNFCNSTKTKIQMFYKHLLHQKWIWISINSTGIQSSLLCKFDQIYFIYPIAIFSGTLQYFESLLYCTVTLLSNKSMLVLLIAPCEVLVSDESPGMLGSGLAAHGQQVRARTNHKIYFYFPAVTSTSRQHSDFIGNRNNIYQNTLDLLSSTRDARCRN